MPLYNLQANPETKTRSAKSLRREERFEGSCGRLRRHARTIVGDRQEDSLSARSVVSLFAPNKKTPAGWMQPVDRLADQVTPHLANLALKAMDGAPVGAARFHSNV